MASGPAMIEHVFVLMLENRSFDHMLGFSALRGTDAETAGPTQIDGVDQTTYEIDPTDGTVVPQASADLTMVGPDPRHEFEDVLLQLGGVSAAYNPSRPYPVAEPHHTGFIESYRRGNAPSARTVMNGFDVGKLPVLNALAASFAVCDHWFASMPGPTWPNRFFSHAASSAGLDSSPFTFTVVDSELV